MLLQSLQYCCIHLIQMKLNATLKVQIYSIKKGRLMGVIFSSMYLVSLLGRLTSIMVSKCTD
jgi:hypothetical protein